MRPIVRAFAPVVLAGALAAPLAACHFGGSDDDKPGISASGSGLNRTYPTADFSEVTLAGGDDVDVRVGTGYSVRAEGPSDVLDKLRIRKEGETLTIDRRGNSWGKSEAVKIVVTLPRITKATVAGSGDMSIDRVEVASFDGTVAGSGTLKIAGGTTESLALTTAGSGDIAAAGTTRALKIQGAGSGNVDAARVTATSADVSMAGSGDVKAAVNGNAKVNIMGSGNVDLGPNAHCKTNKMGSGEVRCAY